MDLEPSKHLIQIFDFVYLCYSPWRIQSQLGFLGELKTKQYSNHFEIDSLELTFKKVKIHEIIGFCTIS